MTTNYKTSFLLPHDYEIPTFNYPQYVLPPVPYNYKPYTKYIIPSDVILPLITKITAPAQCTNTKSLIFTYSYSYVFINLFNNNYYDAYYETEIDLRQIDPTIQSISNFQNAYKTIEISNLGDLQVECSQPNIENFIPNRNIILNGGVNSCDIGFGSLENITLQESGYSQTDKINFDNIIILYTYNIKVNDNETKYATGVANGLPNKNYENSYTLVGW